jgi:chromosome segregation ATPase
MSDHELKAQLASCESQLRSIREDRDRLRESSSEFADLAERLSEQVRLLRRKLEDLQQENSPSGG